MPHAEHTVTVNRPPREVFGYLADGTHNRGPVQPGPWMGPAQHSDLMPQHQEFSFPGGRRPAGHDKPAAEPGEDEIKQAEGYG